MFLLFHAVCYNFHLDVERPARMNKNEDTRSEISPNEMFSHCWRALFVMLKQPSVRKRGNAYVVLSGPVLQQEKQKIHDLQHKMAALLCEDFNDPVTILSEMINNAKPAQFQTKFDTFVDTYEILLKAVTPTVRCQIWLNTHPSIARHRPALFDQLARQIVHEQATNLTSSPSAPARKL